MTNIINIHNYGVLVYIASFTIYFLILVYDGRFFFEMLSSTGKIYLCTE